MRLMKLVLFCFIIFISLSFISAVNLDITSKPIIDTILNNQNNSAVYEFKIFNNDIYNDFEIYTFERFSISQKEFTLSPEGSTTLTLEFVPFGSLVRNEGHLSVPVYFLNKGGKVPKIVNIDIEIVDLKNAFGIKAENITIDENTFNVNFFNREKIVYDKVKVVLNSPFIDDYSTEFSVNSLEEKSIQIPVNKEKIKKLVYGNYVLLIDIIVGTDKVTLQVPVKISEKTGILSKEESSGVIVRKDIIEKTNDGNVLTNADIILKKNAISRLFTTFSLEPNSVERKGFFIYYSWSKDLQPDETLRVKATTNWTYPLIVVILLLFIFYLVNLYYARHLIIRKKVTFVKSKSNDFALKVTLRIKAKKYMENVKINDRLPAMAQIYDKYGNLPTHVDPRTGLIRWDFKHLASGEERVLEYIFYSKLKVVGKFELPSAVGVYEIQGKIHEAQSNHVFFINEQESQKNNFGKAE